MFVQIHMLQSMPPGNLNRDDSGQPKKCVFGGVTRGRISSQCLKRNIRRSPQFEEAFGAGLAVRSLYLPRLIGDALKDGNFGVLEDELNELLAAIAAKFKKEKRGSDDGDAEAETQESPEGSISTAGDAKKTAAPTSVGGDAEKTGQLVFFPQPYAHRIAELVAELRQRSYRAYSGFIGRKVKPKLTKDEEKEIKRFVDDAFNASKSLTVDIGLFGRMTTSDLVVNVEAACQVAHAISTHETLIESDYFTAMDDLKDKFVSTQTDRTGAAFLGSGETETFFNSAVYYKYLNLDVDALKKQLPTLSAEDAARVAGVLVAAAAFANPTGKQNSFASHTYPELVLVEMSKTKRPLSYANAFLQPVEGGLGRNLMTESAKALCDYIDSVAAAFVSAGVRRVLLAVGPASATLASEPDSARTVDELAKTVAKVVKEGLEEPEARA